ncbi:hypothetical protein BHM03_00034927 [Ensete ventricosum]|nr:hypothetical protein BHM03_00034927 [Ensete ventricosum]
MCMGRLELAEGALIVGFTNVIGDSMLAAMGMEPICGRPLGRASLVVRADDGRLQLPQRASCQPGHRRHRHTDDVVDGHSSDNAEHVLLLTKAVLPVIGLYELANCPQTTGRVVLDNPYAFYLVGAPVALVLAFWFDLGFQASALGYLQGKLHVPYPWYAAFFLFKHAPLFPPPPQKMKIRNERSRGGSSERMAGLSVLLETQESFPKYTHILSKTSLKNYASSTSSCSTHRSTFLEDCYLCRRRLQHGKDIYMYRSGTKDKFLSSTVQFVPGVFRNGVHSGNRNTVSLTLRGYYLADFCVNITAEETEPSVAKSAGDGRYLWTRRAGRGTTAPWPRRRAGSTRWGAAAGGRPSGDGCLPVVLLIRSCSLQEENDSSVIVFIYNYT